MKKELLTRKVRMIKRLIVLFGFAAVIISCQTVEREIYQIKIYSLSNSEQEISLDNYLKNAYIPALNRTGINNVGVFKLIEEKNLEVKHIYVFVPFKSVNQFEQLEDKINIDKKYLEDGTDYINTSHDNPPYVRIENILLRAFTSMPKYGVPEHTSLPSERIYELRSYQAATEKLYHKKVEMFNSGGESKIFMDLGFQPIFFGEVISGSTMPNLMYLTTFEDKTSNESHWHAFRDSPDWLLLKEDKQYDNTVSKIEKLFLHPTDYSEL